VDIQKVAKEYKHIKIKIYNITDNNDKMRIVVGGIVDKSRYYVIENFTIPITELNIDEAINIIETNYKGKRSKRVNYDDGRYTVELKVESIKRKQAALEWIESIILIYKLAG
jgi:hypothetical protein